MTGDLKNRVSDALSSVQNPRVGKDVVTAGMIQDLQVDDDGRVSFTFLLDRMDPATLVRRMRSAVRGVDGVSDVKLKVREPTGAGGGGGPGGLLQGVGLCGACPKSKAQAMRVPLFSDSGRVIQEGRPARI